MKWDGLGAYGTIPFDPLRLFAGDVFSAAVISYTYLYTDLNVYSQILFSRLILNILDTNLACCYPQV